MDHHHNHMSNEQIQNHYISSYPINNVILNYDNNNRNFYDYIYNIILNIISSLNYLENFTLIFL